LTQIHGRQPIIFCDFDGTITTSDNILALMKHFDPPGWENILHDLLEGRKSLKAAVGEMFALFPSEQKTSVQDYVLQSAGIREGFAQLLAYCKQSDIPFLITSGGIDFFIYPLLAPFDINPEQIYCNQSNFKGSHIEIVWQHSCDELCDKQCGMCKTRVIRQYPSEQYYRILIGDSLTDFEGSKIVDFVFARSHLLERCQQTNLLHKPYESFFDVIEHLRSLSANSEYYYHEHKEGKR
jgi:2-hydroxy-3-keto-5-methylthiopentenyl-1-phosphate phosphatase